MIKQKEFQHFLKKGGRSPSAVERIVALVGQFEQFLKEIEKELGDTTPEDLEAFVDRIEEKPKASAKLQLWALGYYFRFTGNETLVRLASVLREERIKRQPFPLAKFRDANLEYVEKLAAAGIKNVKQMLRAGAEPAGRQELAAKSGVPLEAILEFVKLSDLARIPGLKAIRARLYYDAGLDTLDKIAQWDPEEMRAMLIDFVERTGFEGIAPLPAEARSTVNQAQKLPQVVTYDPA
jgi:hypothetical protein